MTPGAKSRGIIALVDEPRHVIPPLQPELHKRRKVCPAQFAYKGRDEGIFQGMSRGPYALRKEKIKTSADSPFSFTACAARSSPSTTTTNTKDCPRSLSQSAGKIDTCPDSSSARAARCVDYTPLPCRPPTHCRRESMPRRCDHLMRSIIAGAKSVAWTVAPGIAWVIREHFGGECGGCSAMSHQAERNGEKQ